MPEPNILSYYEPGGISRTEVKGTFPVIEPMTVRDQLMALIDNESRALPRKPLTPLSRKTSSPMATRTVTVRPQRQGPTSERQTAAAGGGGTGVNPSLITPRSLGRFQMNHTGNWGTFVDPADIPAGLQDQIMGGFYGQAGNWDSSNPSIMGPQQWRTGKYTHGGGVSMPSEIRQPDTPSSNSGFDYLPAVEQARWLAAYGRG